MRTFSVYLVLLLAGCGSDGPVGVGDLPSETVNSAGEHIAWKEHLIDDRALGGGVRIEGGDGLAASDIDKDGFQDYVAAYEDSDYIRVVYGSDDPDTWFRLSLAEGKEAKGVEDVALGDLNGDGWLDLIAACEGGHLLYLQHPASKHRGFRWGRIGPEITMGRGSWIRASFADFNGDGKLEVLAVNKGVRDAESSEEPRNISWFSVDGDPLQQENWQEHPIIAVATPVNAQAVDLDGDGDLDVFAGSRQERRVFWLENVSADGEIAFENHDVALAPAVEATGFQLDFHDFNADGRTDVALAASDGLIWIEQPETADQPWTVHRIGDIKPDVAAGIFIGDIDGDGDADLMTGSYSEGPRDEDGEDITADNELGRIAWFQNPGDASGEWSRQDIVRRKRGMFDGFVAKDLDEDGDLDIVTTRGNSGEFDGLIWLEQQHGGEGAIRFIPAREAESRPMPLPE